MRPDAFPLAPFLTIVVMLFLLLTPAPALAHFGHDYTAAEDDWKATYPAPVSNITQDPWTVKKGENVKVALTLDPEAEVPERVSMIWCRVEPDYVCALPLLMEQQDPQTWTATIPGSYGGERDVIQQDTRHIGYNISLRYPAADENSTGDRYWAPTHNTWTPATFPEDSVGEYYFIRLQDTENAPAPLLAVLFVVLATVLLVLARSNRPQGPPERETRRGR